MRNLIDAWQFWALLSAVFAALTAIFAKVGIENINSDFATFIRTIVIMLVLPIAVPPVPVGARVPNVSLQMPGFVVSYRNQAVVESRFASDVPLSRAVVGVMSVAVLVTVVGAPGVVKLRTLPAAVPTCWWPAPSRCPCAAPGC